ncbi:uncharacterized protein LOC129968199 [Argiope bruennichi]|uniref:uncharacterized protein LOC129968199 n=1 Tax=Argiope bruennichi TaxID=94029 RepID=UPI002494948E|nr:uncharacterized protein LOC129968199 [Argiope bruennichi]
MFKTAKGFLKEDLLFVAEEIGETLPDKVKISELKDIILNSKEYLDDPDFVTNILVTAVSQRKLKEEQKQKQTEFEKAERLKQLEYEESGKIREHELELARIRATLPITGESQNTVISGAKKKFNLPKLEFRQFNGDIKDWLQFWSQFQHIHNDDEIAPEKKFQYLVQATVNGSRAREVVESFPATAANYAKAVESLKARFGRDELLVEVYVRELLKLIISVQKHEKISMTSLYDKLESYLRALETLGVTTDKCASILYPMVESCFQEDFLKAWNRSASSAVSTDAKDRLTNLMTFLKVETEGEEKINLAMAGFGLGADENRQSFKKKVRDFPMKKVPTAANLFTTASKEVKKECVFCTGKHSSPDCFQAQKMSLAERYNILREKQCCFACLTPKHTSRSCKAFLRCVICGKKHVPLMCESLEAKNQDSFKSENKSPNVEVNMANNTSSPRVFLQTLKLKMVCGNKEIPVRAILDSGSQKTYVLKNVVEKMGYIPLRKEILMHSLFGGIKSDKCEHNCYRIKLRNQDNSVTCNLEALDQPSICDKISSVIPGSWITELREMKIRLSDVGEEPQSIQVLLGSDVIGKLMTGQRRVLSCGLVAMETLLGWTLSGKVPENEMSSCNAMLVASLFVKEMDISQLWRLDSLGIQDPSEQKTKEELHKASMEHFLRTVKVDEEERFLVSLPWLDGHLPLPDNFNLALKGLQVTTHKLKKENLFQEYGDVFKEWEREGIIEEVPQEEIKSACHYLPHRHVVKPNNTTKIRPVFKASSKQKGAVSLNDCLEKGLNLIELIPSMLTRFRLYRFGISADIRKAFLQISLYKEDRNFLRFLWHSEEGELIHYRHCRVVFGVSSSPFLLGSTIQYHLERKLEEAQQGRGRYPECIIQKLMNSFYVDNCLASVKTQSELERFIDVATEIMAERKFDLRGWEHSSPSDPITSPTIILGTIWDRHCDTLSINIPDLRELMEEVITKRNILAASHKVFDPLGITSPVLLLPKLWLQNLWKSKIGWDEEVDLKTRQDFLKWLMELEYLKHSKTRIAPCGKKETTIASLELLGAAISARLSSTVLKEFPTDNVYFWTDSTTVLAWLKREEPWGVFVYNRVQEIRKLTPVKAWRHVPGSLNPADCPSRGCSAKQLCSSKWWEGPSWLYLSSHEWPVSDMVVDVNEEEVNKERRAIVTSLVNIQTTDIKSEYFSTYSRNIRVVAWILRFIHNVSNATKLKGNLVYEEFRQAEILCFKSMQSNAFQDEKLLAKMQAFKDEDGLLRIRTKLADSCEKEDFKFPILLPANDVVIKLIREEHIKAMHAGSSILLARLREKFWIIRAKRLVKPVLSECVICKRYKAKHLEVPFAPLPKDRVTQTKVFEVTGVDYAGPLYLKSKGKAWIVLFTCAVYRAVHFELVRSLTTDTFIQALRRFIARRGRISVLYSDNGTNFVGTNNALRALDWDKISVYSTAQKITWKFIPPTAAWWGGWWERIVRMLKELLRRVLGKSIINYEELLTILCDCESIINARPLTYIQDDPNELLPLTPAMFIHGNSNYETPDLDKVDRSSLVKRTKYLQKLREDLRQRFRNEYLALLVHRGTRKSDVLEVGDVVLIGHDNIRRIDWPLGVILEVYPGKDGVPRVARIRTSHGERIRPFQRLYPLEVSAKTEIDVLKAPGKSGLSVEKTPDLPTDHVPDSPIDHVPDSPADHVPDLPADQVPNSPVERTDISEEVHHTKTRLGSTIKVPSKLDL